MTLWVSHPSAVPSGELLRHSSRLVYSASRSAASRPTALDQRDGKDSAEEPWTEWGLACGASLATKVDARRTTHGQLPQREEPDTGAGEAAARGSHSSHAGPLPRCSVSHSDRSQVNAPRRNAPH
jgi:hypothetical protein